MRALTVRQPWATAIIRWGKDVENRTRNIAGGYRGPVAIHAGLQVDDRGMESPLIGEALRDRGHIAPERRFPWEPDLGSLFGAPLHVGAFVGVVDLDDVHDEWDCMPATPASMCSPWAQTACQGSHGNVCPASVRPMQHLVVANPRPLVEPVPAKGRLGLWTPSPEEQLAIVERIGHAA